MIDNIIDAYARAVYFTRSNPAMQSRYGTQMTEWMTELTNFYKYRNNNSDATLQQFINGVAAKPLPSSDFAMTAPATTTPATTPAGTTPATTKPTTTTPATPTTPANTNRPATTKPTTTTPAARPATAPTTTRPATGNTNGTTPRRP